MCDRCHELHKRLTTTQDRVLLKHARLLLEDHLAGVLSEKKRYWRHIQKARQEPTGFMSTILDGMDTMKSVVPHWSRIPASFKQAWNMPYHVEGVIKHGHEPHSSAYVSPPGIKKGGCLAIETLIRVLIRHKKDHGYLPPVWYIQADNAPSEFKNSVCLMFLGMLVQLGVFEKVRCIL